MATAGDLSPHEIEISFNAIKCRDITEEMEFMTRFDAMRRAIRDQVRDFVMESQIAWRKEMEAIIPVPKAQPAAWLNFLAIELGGSCARITVSLDRWIINERDHTILQIREENTRATRFFYKKFIGGVQSSERLAVLLQERANIKTKLFTRVFNTREEGDRKTFEEIKNNVVQITKMFTRIFQQAIA